MRSALAILLLVSGCAAPPPAPSRSSFDARLAALEQSSGGRLGVALVDETGRHLAGRRAEERFAFCSTFKLPLAGMILDGSRRGLWSLDERLPVTAADLVPYAPVTERSVGRGWISIREAVEAIVTVSDNPAANLLLKRVGGLGAFNAWLAEHGDRDSRLDRFETSLNENAPGDPRDTTTPSQMARHAAHLLFGDWLVPEDKALLRTWLIASRTGLPRIRAGLPAGWTAGDKTGTCGSTSVNDVAFIVPAGGQAGYALAVYLDRPRVEDEAAYAVLAEVARAATPLISD
jgi:beta-lactamase class A